jgi:hypothetical protein
LQHEIPEFTSPFVDDVPIKSVRTRYQREDGSYETIPENAGIRRFIWEHCIVVNRILQRLENVGATVSASKFVLAAPTAIIVGHKCTFEGRVPEESKVQKIRDWPEPTNQSQVRGFLGTCGVLRIFIRDFSRIARPLVNLTRKDAPFIFGPEQREAMQTLKDSILESPALRRIDYDSEREVILAVDTSNIAVGFILLQIGEDGKRYPNRFGSIALNDVERRYSQAKLELFGLFRALRAVRVYIFGVKNLTVEVDAKYIKGMINNPDLQPNATINRWIAGILLFSFKLVHVSAQKHKGVDGLSRRPVAEDDPIEDDNHEDWIDRAYSFAIALLNDRTHRIAGGSGDIRHEAHRTCFISQSARVPALRVYFDVAQTEEPEPDIPRSDAARAQDALMTTIEQFLTTRERPTDVSDEEFEKFVNNAARYFVLEGNLWRRASHGKHQLVLPPNKRYRVLKEAHDDLGHKGIYTVSARLRLRFWWPRIIEDIKWYGQTCHECQVRQTRRLHIPPIVPIPGGLFRKAHIDTMKMPRAGGYEYLVQARCALTSYPEWRMLRKENTNALTAFIFEELLCRWGPITEIVTDNAPAYRLAVDELARKYGIHPIRISPYNSQANGIVERRHRDVREAIIKSCDGDDSRWYQVVHSVFWAERVTIHKATGLSPYFMMHGVEPIFPFDLAEATFLAPLPSRGAFTTTDLIAWRARQLQKRVEDINAIRDKVVAARYKSIRDFERRFRASIKSHDFEPGALVLVRNSKVEYELSKKTKPRYLGPMIVVRRTKGGSYMLAELDGAISKLRFAAFRVIPYYPRSEERVSVTQMTGVDDESIDELEAYETVEPDEDEPERAQDG